MKAHKFQITTYESSGDFIHGMSQLQTRLYIPNRGILAFRKGEKNADFFDERPEAIAEAEKWLKGNANVEVGFEYQGEVELPDRMIAEVVERGRTLNQAEIRFNESANSLVDLLKDKSPRLIDFKKT